MVEVIFIDKFKNIFSKIKDNSLKERIIKQIEKIKINPEVGKPMRNVRKGTRELYVKPYRLSYEFFKDKNLIYILDIYHKDEQ
ncbi:type II toxin-antitoxin system RelE/ParE family toxin [Candidatus Pacearchaeota archaeon]|nr:type II toxin-antitoxin system RelE/ParE family toxin [Candidatus Pacearchaeota archaeon]